MAHLHAEQLGDPVDVEQPWKRRRVPHRLPAGLSRKVARVSTHGTCHVPRGSRESQGK